eukprot:gene5516-5925_t
MSKMLSLEERVKISMRRGSAVPIMKNPLENSRSSSGEELNIKISTGIDSRPITPVETLDLITRLRVLQSEASRFLEFLDNYKNPYLFHSDDLLQMLALVESSKTKLSILNMIVPRLIDPKGSIDQVTAMFRFADEKSQVEELYKERMQIVNASLFKRIDKANNVLAAGRGRGAAGVGGRGSGGTRRPFSLPASLSEETVSIFTAVKSTDSQSALLVEETTAETTEEAQKEG